VPHIGLALPQLGPHVDRDALRSFCLGADASGFDGLWVQQHLFYPHHPPSGYHGTGAPIPEQYRTVYSPTELLSAAAAWTEHVRLGTSVLVAGPGSRWAGQTKSTSRWAPIPPLAGRGLRSW
jgi:alkanesulfonate monooxygenase SsuD/methylene tetrahydromethanopterin reductase-like flavin-dependent oxidoreductase (luciferase family)